MGLFVIIAGVQSIAVRGFIHTELSSLLSDLYIHTIGIAGIPYFLGQIFWAFIAALFSRLQSHPKIHSPTFMPALQVCKNTITIPTS